MTVDPRSPADGRADPTDRSGETLGEFVMLRRLGEGGMGQVYLAEQASLKRRVAIKVLRNDLASNEVSRKRFRAEAEAVASLVHANIVQLHAFHDETSPHYMVLEYVEGRNLRDFLLRKGPPDVPLALSIMWQIAAALQRAAEFGIVHRDIKPENILLTRKNEVKVTDFGLSRFLLVSQDAKHLTQTGVTMGTPMYMSPEQVEGKPIDHRTDVYSFGVTCYHLLAGQPPFEGENAFAVALQHVQKEPAPLETLRPDLPPELCAMIARMMAKKPEDRYQSAGEILRDLKPISDRVSNGQGDPVMAWSALNVPATQSLPDLIASAPPQPIARTAGTGWLFWSSLVAGSLALALGGGALTAWTLRPPPEEAVAEGPEAVNSASVDTLIGPYKRRERAYRDLINDTESPGKERDDLRRGIQHRMELGLLYLEHEPRELKRADDLFTTQRKSKISEYEHIGRIGEVMVLAFKDEPEKSNKLLMESLPMPPDMPPNLRWMRMLLTALDHNKRNCAAQELKYPEPLKRFEENQRRRPGIPPAVTAAGPGERQK